MLKAPLTVRVAAILMAATWLASCSQQPDEAFTGLSASPTGEIGFEEVAVGDCLADVSLSNGKLQTADCSSDGALTVIGVTKVGDAAPTQEPSPAMRNAFGSDACDPMANDWAENNDRELTGLLQAITIDDDWSGAETAVVCSIVLGE